MQVEPIFSIMSWLGGGSREARLPDIGTRELHALDVLWANGTLTAQATLEKMQTDDLSLSTVQSTLERLTRKQLVKREKVGRAYAYTAAISKQGIISRLISEIADSLAGGETAPMVSGFLDYMGKNAGESDESLESLQDLDRADKR